MDLYYEDHGLGMPILFVHGMCGNANAWDGQVGRLSGEFRCITYDRRGHTRSTLGSIGQRTVELHADDAAKLVETLGIAPCLLVASSGGARIGVDLVRRYGQLFVGAVLSEPPIFSLDPEGGAGAIMSALQPPIQAAMAAGEPRGAVDAFFAYMCPGLWSALDDAGREPYRANHVELMGDLQMPPYQISLEDLRRIETPVTMVSGSVSNPVLRRVARVIAEALPNSTFAEIDGVGHVTYAEAPDEFAAIARRAAATAREARPRSEAASRPG